MNTKTLVKELKALGVDISQKTLINWGRDGIVSGCLISTPDRRSRGRPKKRPENADRLGPGRFRTEWSDEAKGEAAAVWVVSGGSKRIPKKRIDQIKAAAACAYRYPSTFYDPPRIARITGPDPTSQWIKPWHLWRTMIHDDDELNALATTWIAAREKATRNVLISKQKQVIFHWRSRPRGEEEEKTIFLGRLEGSNAFAIGGPEAREQLEALMAKGTREQDLPSSSFIKDPRDPDGGPLGFQQEYTRMVVSPDAPNGWQLLPVRWAFDIERIELVDAPHDDIVFLLDGRDSRIKAFYAPYDVYDPSVDYERRALRPND